MTRFSLACLFCINGSLFACLTLFINLQQKTDRVSYFHQAKLIKKNALYVYFFRSVNRVLSLHVITSSVHRRYKF